MTTRILRISLFFLTAALQPLAGLACSVCFGAGDNGDMARGFYWGVVMLGSLPFLLMAGFVAYIARAGRRSRAAQSPEPSH